MVTRAPFGTSPVATAVELFTLDLGHGVEARVTNYGAIITSLRVPDRDGRLAEVVLGHDTIEGYRRDARYTGAIVGRYANRIADARFVLDGTTYRLAANDGRHHLHGGIQGFDKVVWRAAPFQTDHTVGLVLDYTSPDGEEGYPGTLDARVTYTLTDRRELIVDYLATTDRATPVNLTQHSYFNLAGAGKGDILGHLLQINAHAMTPVDDSKIPTGALVPVALGPFDFRSPISIGARMPASGYDHNFVLDGAPVGGGPVHAARLVDPVSGRTLDVTTTEPGLQVYSGDGSAVCLETQHYPDSPNRPEFPSAILRPGSTYRTRTMFSFDVNRLLAPRARAL